MGGVNTLVQIQKGSFVDGKAPVFKLDWVDTALTGNVGL
jgi:hypothetical protein